MMSVASPQSFPMTFRKTILSILIALCFQASPVLAQSPNVAPIDWLSGPFTAELSGMATLPIPEGYLFADTANTRRYLKACEVRVTGSELAIVRPHDEQSDWYIVFEFADDGYVEDDTKESIDADAAIKVLREINDEENAERSKMGWAPTKLIGWEKPPTYDTESNNLEWALRVEREGIVDVNYNARTLGRHGVMTVNLVVGPQDLDTVLPVYQSLINGFQYSDGHRYGEFKKGDKIARYGLTALITGTAATAVIKTGLLRRLLAPILLAFLAGVSAVKRWFDRTPKVPPKPPIIPRANRKP